VRVGLTRETADGATLWVEEREEGEKGEGNRITLKNCILHTSQWYFVSISHTNPKFRR